MNIPFNKPHLTGNERYFVDQAISHSSLSGNGFFTKSCQNMFSKTYGFGSCFMTNSCSSALEIAAILCEFNNGDEIIVPSYGYVTSASAFEKNGATLVFADSELDRPHISVKSIAEKITPKTKAILVIHYAGSTCDMDGILKLVEEHELILIEDAAHSIHGKSGDHYQGGIGHLSTFSFHETKNIHCGEGGMLVVNDDKFLEKARQIWQEGTNRFAFSLGEVKKYEWVSKGSSYQPSDLIVGFLFAQLEQVESISEKRLKLWNQYRELLSPLEQHTKSQIELAKGVTEGHNAHIFYMKLSSKKLRDELLAYLLSKGIQGTFHYLPLHLSPFWLKKKEAITLPNAEMWSEQLLRLPLFIDLTFEEQQKIASTISEFFDQRNS